MWVEVGKDSQMCPWLHVIGKREDKPMSYVAALHLVRNKNYVHDYYGPYAYCSLDQGVAYTRGWVGTLPKALKYTLTYRDRMVPCK